MLLTVDQANKRYTSQIMIIPYWRALVALRGPSRSLGRPRFCPWGYHELTELT